jgi:hypothetical protein
MEWPEEWPLRKGWSVLVTACTQHSYASSCSFRVRASLDTGQGPAIMGLTQTVDAAGALFRNNIKPFLYSSTRRLNKVSRRLWRESS